MMALFVVWIDWLTRSPWSEEEAVVEVAVRLRAVRSSVNIPLPVTARATPGVVEPMPTKSEDVDKTTVAP
ncbi:MAG: hypothetical protein A3H69_04855 [Candidatus Sungbacteria bacterium RIFCSPLOWO2_02_FULL_47_9]|nr:MAG: hypothetical protein A3H69_04855 [Candidatus Sungbacteria bacterium RIFCSPLOWO2_02_FULL_47_9]